MLDPVGSTSWHNRHLACFRRLADLLAREDRRELTVLIVGPGAVTRLAAPLLNDTAVRRPRWREWLGDLARYADQALRRIPCLPLRSLEPLELQAALGRPYRLIVIDRSARALRAVARDLPDAECHNFDITTGSLPVTADVVVAFNVICRLTDPARGLRHLVGAVRPGGWLLIDDRSAESHLSGNPLYQLVAPKIHRRNAL